MIKNKKRILLVIAAMLVSLFCGCGKKTCKESGCDETELFKDGYCEWHYYENAAGDVLEELFR